MALGRKTGGRQKGSTNKRTAATKAAAEASVAAIMAVVPDAFDGDAHAFLMSVYRDPAHPIDVRIDAAGKAIGFEKPKLAAIDMSMEGNVRHVVSDAPVDRDGVEWVARHRVDTPVTH